MVARISVLVALSALGCSDRLVDPEGERDGSERYAEGTPEAELILRAANELTLEELDVEVALDSRAAENIVAERSGPDGADGTDDDTPFETVEALDAVPYVGEAALDALLAFATELWASGGEVHGVLEGSEDAALILHVANTADPDHLEDRAGVPGLAAFSIFEGRIGPDGLDGTGDDTPFTSLASLDATPWVDGPVFEALLAYGKTLPPEGDCPDGFIVSSDGKTMFSDLTSAAEQSPDGTVLEVCAGTFYASLISPRSVTLRGRGIGITVIQGTGSMFQISEGRSVTLERISFVGSGEVNNGHYGGIYTRGDNELVVKDSEFVGHKLYAGSAIYAHGRVELRGVTFADNVSNNSGGAIWSDGELDLHDVTFTGNSTSFGSGGAVSLTNGGRLTAERVSFRSNQAPTQGGGAIFGDDTSSVTLVDSEFFSNSSPRGGAIWSQSTLEATDVDFGRGANDNSVGDVYAGTSGAVFYYGNGVSIRCDGRSCI